MREWFTKDTVVAVWIFWRTYSSPWMAISCTSSMIYQCYIVSVWIELIVAFLVSRFAFFFSLHVNSNLTWVHCIVTKITIHHCLHTVYTLKNIINGSHGTIHTFKNYFATVLSVFNFSNNKLNPNRPFVFFWRENWYLPLIWKIM